MAWKLRAVLTALVLAATYGAISRALAQQQQDVDEVKCDHTTEFCRCRDSAEACEFTFEVDYLQTFTRYVVNEGRVDSTDGHVYVIEESQGTPVPLQPDDTACSSSSASACTSPETVDGRTFRPFYAINGQIPGPTLIVHHRQAVIVHVINNLREDGISLHWHGMFQYDTPWMDGTGFISQCPIPPNTNFTYIFRADPAGSFWYHTHIGSHRSDGMFGGLIILEEEKAPDSDYVDLPEQHTLLFQDWWQQPFSDVFSLQHATGEMFYPSVFGELPRSPEDAYEATKAPDDTEIGQVPFFSGLINGKGRNADVPFNRSILSVFEVEDNQKYRFRAIGSQTIYAVKLSVDQHKLKVIAVDGFFVQPVTADFIIVHTGERYDFVLEASQEVSNYWIRAETLEIDPSSNTAAPFQSLGHSYEAVLHYSSAVSPTGSNYGSISSTRRTCTSSEPCTVVNCPFEAFHPLYAMNCVNVGDLKLLNPTPMEELPQLNPDTDQEYFLNFGYEGDGLPDNINGRAFSFPQRPLQVSGNFDQDYLMCPPDPHSCKDGCSCLHVLSIPFDKTVRLVLTNTAEETHPIHLHGHSFFVLKVGYGRYNNNTGFLMGTTNTLTCGGNDLNEVGEEGDDCTAVSWRDNTPPPDLRIDQTTVRKDTVIVPAGGYVVLQFISNNPGYWFMHCHIEPHQMEGMAMVFNVARERQNSPPDEIPACGSFDWTLDEFYEKLEFDPGSTNEPLTDKPYSDLTMFCHCVNEVELGLAIGFGVLGLLVLLVVPYILGVLYCCKYYRLKRRSESFPLQERLIEQK